MINISQQNFAHAMTASVMVCTDFAAITLWLFALQKFSFPQIWIIAENESVKLSLIPNPAIK